MVVLVDYDGDSECIIVIDKDVFTEEKVLGCLGFWMWAWDKEEDPYKEYAKKIARKVWSLSQIYSFHGVVDWFMDAEGWPPMDGSYGIKIEEFDAFEFDDELINVVTVSTSDEKKAKD